MTAHAAEPRTATRRRVLAQALAGLGWAGAGWPAPGLAATAPPARSALVIGNERYAHNPLRSAANDARAMADLLKRAGFAVDLRQNAARDEMVQAIEALGRALAGPDVGTALFYYAGHAAQLDWRNYLLPVDGRVGSAADVPQQCVDLGLVMKRLQGTRGKTKLIFLDACRDDPFGPRLRLPTRGMSPYDAPPGTLLAYATAPGRVALELDGRPNGLYTEHLLRELAVPGVRVEDALKRVRLNVRLASRGKQVPWESTSLEEDVYLLTAPRPSEAELERQLRDEYRTWTRIRSSTDPDDWVQYLRRYPNGKFAELAQVRLRRLLDTREPAPKPAATARKTALRLGQGLPVPAPLDGSGNPYSAGTYAFRPVWTPGDEYVFEERDVFSGVARRRFRSVVRRVDTRGNRVAFADGSVVDLMGGPLRDGDERRYDVPIQINPVELQVGRKWSSRYEQTGQAAGTGEYDFRITTREEVTVPAGRFSAFRIEAFGSFNGKPLQLTRWVVPGLNLAVRRDARHAGLARVLVSARQAVWA